MEYRRLGRSGLKLSALSLGSWVTFGRQVDVGLAADLIKTAYDAGVNFFDNAEAYEQGRSELIMGEAIQRLGLQRDSFCVSSKVLFGSVPDPSPLQRGLSRKHLVEACHQALERLRVEYLDLYFCHRPDPEAPMEEIVTTMHNLVAQGKILYWGTSEWPAADIMQAYGIARHMNLTPPAMEQVEYNMVTRDRFEKEYAVLYREIGLGTTIFCPLKSGILTGKYNGGIPADSRLGLKGFEWLVAILKSPEGQGYLDKVRRLLPIAKDLGATMTNLALAWCLKNPHVSTVILGASRVSQLEENLKSLDVVGKLTEEALGRIESVLSPK